MKSEVSINYLIGRRKGARWWPLQGTLCH